jgi:hypothetical protein
MRPFRASPTVAASGLDWRIAGWLMAAAVLLVFILANAHLIYVALGSQPGCALPHDVKVSGEPTNRAASPAC